MTPATARKLIARAGKLAKPSFPVHPHMLRHACGFKLASEGQDTRAIQQYLGHMNITHAVCDTELRADRFKRLEGLTVDFRLTANDVVMRRAVSWTFLQLPPQVIQAK